MVLPLLREALPGAQVCTWVEDASHRTYPVVVLNRQGGDDVEQGRTRLQRPKYSLTVVSDEDHDQAEELYADAVAALRDACRRQTVTPAGWVPWVKATGPMVGRGPWPDTYQAEGTVQVSVRETRRGD